MRTRVENEKVEDPNHHRGAVCKFAFTETKGPGLQTNRKENYHYVSSYESDRARPVWGKFSQSAT